MKELLALVLIVLQLSHINARHKRLNEVREIRQDIFPVGNSLVEIDVLKDNYLTPSRHVIKKRQAEPSGDPEAGQSRRRRRRRRKKIPGSRSNDQPMHLNDGPPFKSSIDGPINPPEENFLMPRKRTSRRRRPTPPPAAFESLSSVAEAPVLNEKPVLSEMRRESTDGLLRAEELQAEYIKTDMMRAEKLKADRIKADKVKAKDVIVTSKSSRRRRPRISEFVLPEPIYEQRGIQRVNSVVDNPVLDTATRDYFYPYEMATRVPRYEKVDTNSPFLQPRRQSKEAPPQLKDIFTKRRILDSVSPSGQQSRDPLPEFSSAKVLDQFSNNRSRPKLSEFIEEPASFISNRKRKPAIREDLSFSSQYYQSPTIPPFDNQDQQFSTQDKTSKTYTSKSDPWYFK